MSPTLRALSLLLAATLLPTPASSQVIEFTKIVDEESEIRGYGDRPALHAGELALLARDQTTGLAGIYRTPTDGMGPFTLVVDELTPIPNNPGAVFDHLDNPAIFDGQVIFTGGDDSDINDGVYRGTGGPLEVLVDRFGGDPAPARPAADEAGIVFEVAPSFYETPYFQPADLSTPSAMALAGTPAPGGGTFDSFDHNATPAIGGGLASFTASIAPLEIDHGVYTYDTASGTLDWIANGSTTIPGTTLTFDFFATSDTDGDAVVFVGSEGFICCGGREGVYLAPVGSSGGGPFTIVAETGQPVPDGPPGATFRSFADVAIDGELTILKGSFTDPGTGDTGYGLYGFRGGELFKIIDSTEMLNGSPSMSLDFTHRSLDGNQLVFRARYEYPDAPWGQGISVWVATIRDEKPAAVVSADPLNPPIEIGAGGSSFQYVVTLTNTSAEPQSFEAWSAVTGPVDREPIVGPRAVSLAPGASLTRTLTQQVPEAAPTGMYTYTLSVGTLGDAVIASDSFTFTKHGSSMRSTEAPVADWSAIGWDEALSSGASSVLPETFALAAVVPNPFTTTARVTLDMPEAQRVTVAVFDALGRRVAVLHDGALEAGAHALPLDGRALPSGVYVVRAVGETSTAVKRLTLVR